MAKRIKPSDVFTPTRAPLRQNNVYVQRGTEQRQFETAVERGYTPIVFGDYGVGKTSLSMYCLREARENESLVHLADPHNRSLDYLFKLGLERIGYEVTIQKTDADQIQVESELSGGVFNVLVAKLRGAISATKSRTSELVVKEPTDEMSIKLFSDHEMVFLVDELHRSSDSFRDNLARLIKAVSDFNLDFPKVVLCGTSADANRLVSLNFGIDRLVKEVSIPPMSFEESVKLVMTGFERLGLVLEPGLAGSVAKVASGAPSLLHSICLEMADGVNGDARTLVEKDLQEALKSVISDGANKRLTERYNQAVNRTGELKLRQRILHAMAESDDDFVATGELSKLVSEAVGRHVPQTSLSGPLRELKSDAYGSILSDFSAPGSRERVHNATKFADPQMKAYIRFMGQARLLLGPE